MTHDNGASVTLLVSGGAVYGVVLLLLFAAFVWLVLIRGGNAR